MELNSRHYRHGVWLFIFVSCCITITIPFAFAPFLDSSFCLVRVLPFDTSVDSHSVFLACHSTRQRRYVTFIAGKTVSYQLCLHSIIR